MGRPRCQAGMGDDLREGAGVGNVRSMLLRTDVRSKGSVVEYMPSP